MNNPPAFPMSSGPEPRINEFHEYQEGMTLLDYFAEAMLIEREKRLNKK